MSIIEFKEQSQIIPYSEKQWNDYKIRLAQTLIDDAVHGDMVTANPDLKQFITNYMEKAIESKDSENRFTVLKDSGNAIRLAQLSLDTKEGSRVYPIVNEYHGHFIDRTWYFHSNNDGQFEVRYVEVIPTGIVISGGTSNQ